MAVAGGSQRRIQDFSEGRAQIAELVLQCY